MISKKVISLCAGTQAIRLPLRGLSANHLLLHSNGKYLLRWPIIQIWLWKMPSQANNHEVIAIQLRLKGLYHLMVGDEEQATSICIAPLIALV